MGSRLDINLLQLQRSKWVRRKMVKRPVQYFPLSDQQIGSKYISLQLGLHASKDLHNF